MEPEFIAQIAVLHFHRSWLSVSNRDDGAFRSADAGRAQSDINHCPGNVADLAGISNPQRSVRNNHNPAEWILQCLLSRERHSQAADPESSQGRGQVDPGNVQHNQYANDKNADL